MVHFKYAEYSLTRCQQAEKAGPLRFALVKGQRAEAAPGQTGLCEHCGRETISKCGPIKIAHWAHKSAKSCDSWWEPETSWHRAWKNRFPTKWQEQSQRDEYGELHIADVVTPNGMVIEFQHSSISHREVKKRTDFYNNLCWIVNGLRLKTGWKRFRKALWIGFMQQSGAHEVHKVFLQDSNLVKSWSHLHATTVIDFGSDGLWVVGNGSKDSATVYRISMDSLLEYLMAGNSPPSMDYIEPQPLFT
ncbi:MAG: competence protein CoiA family protein [Hyphomonas sp.]|nr:competence protein CoiA family protein [Hyphomonas sp.]